MALDAGDLSRHHTFRLHADGRGEGVGPDGVHHTRFRTWKQALLASEGDTGDIGDD
jgi:hypothetical protein